MPKRKFIKELRKLVSQRGKVSKVQLEYAKAEERAMMKMYPAIKPSEEVRFSHLRTLEKYVGEQALNMMAAGKGNIAALQKAG